MAETSDRKGKLLQVGDNIPLFSLPDADGQKVDISGLVGQKNLVIYFYPKDFTPGCVKEACGFRDQYEVFKEYGAEVIGISSDSAALHKAFASNYKLDFILLSDRKRIVEKQFGVPRTLFGLLPGRVTFVVDKAGVVRHVFQSQAQASQHVEEALRIIKTLK